VKEEKTKLIRQRYGLSETEVQYFIFSGQTSNSTYNPKDDNICIAMKDGSARDISAVEHAIVNQTLAGQVHKNYICYLQ
jgi:hypothetical protein